MEGSNRAGKYRTLSVVDAESSTIAVGTIDFAALNHPGKF
jgi:hypothetical protein